MKRRTFLKAVAVASIVPETIRAMSGMDRSSQADPVVSPFDLVRSIDRIGTWTQESGMADNVWMNLIQRSEYRGNKHSGSASTFTVGRLDGPSSRESTVGLLEQKYRAETEDYKGPLICQDDLVKYWDCREFWGKYFEEVRNRSVIPYAERMGDVYRQNVFKASANEKFELIPGDSDYTTPIHGPGLGRLMGRNLPTLPLSQEMLDLTAVQLMEDGADEPACDNWIEFDSDGPIFPLLIGREISGKILSENEHRSKTSSNEFLKRREEYVCKRFRHVINPAPARWKLLENMLIRVPNLLKTRGLKSWSENPDWIDPEVAQYESCEVLSRWVMEEEIVVPGNRPPARGSTIHNSLGNWDFISGSEACSGFGFEDPLHKFGLHVCSIHHAFRPIFGQYGRMILFKRPMKST